MNNALRWSAVYDCCMIWPYLLSFWLWNMNTDVNVQPKPVGCETVNKLSAILFVNLVEYYPIYAIIIYTTVFQCIYER